MHGLIRRQITTDAARHDGARLREGLVQRANTARGVWADSAYRSAENEEWVAAHGMVSRIHRKKPRGRPMPKRTRRANAAKSALRSRVEHVFAHQKARMRVTIRTIGLARARAAITLADMAYNMTRWRWLNGRAAPRLTPIGVATTLDRQPAAQRQPKGISPAHPRTPNPGLNATQCGSRRCPRDVPRPRPFLPQPVVRVGQRAAIDAQAAAADADGHLVAQRGQGLDPGRQVGVPKGGEALPVGRVGHRVRRQVRQGGLDLGQRHAGALRDLDDRDPAQRLAAVDAAVRAVALRGDQAPTLVEVQRRDRKPTATRHLPDGEGLDGHVGSSAIGA